MLRSVHMARAVCHRAAEGYLVALTASSGDTVHAEPFADAELRAGVLFGDEDDDE